MMKLKAYKILFFIMCSSHILNAQNRVFGTVTVEDNELTSSNIFIYDDNNKLLTTTDSKGNYEFFTEKNQMKIIFLLVGSQYEEEDVITPLASPASSTSSEGTYELALKPDYSSSEEPEDRYIRIKINDTPPPVDIVREI